MLHDYFARPFTIDRIGRILSILAIIALLWWIFGSLYALLIPFALAWVTAQILYPVVQFVRTRLRVRNNSLSVILVLFLFVVIVAGVIAMLVPSIQSEAKRGWELIAMYATPELFLNLVPETFRGQVVELLNKEKILENINLEQVLEYIRQAFIQGWSVVNSTVNFLMGFAVVGVFIIYLYFILTDFAVLNRGLVHLFPRSYRPFVQELGSDIDRYINSYIRGQGLIALIVGVFLSIGFSIMGMPLGITCGLFIGLLNFIPYLQILGVPPMIILCLLQSASTGQNVWILLLIAFGLLGLSQLLQDLYLTPRIMGKQLGIRPAILLLALTVWGKIAGMVGLFFGLPITMIIYSMYMKYVVNEPLPEIEAKDNTHKRKWRWPWQRKAN